MPFDELIESVIPRNGNSLHLESREKRRNNGLKKWFLPPIWLRFLIIILLICSVFFRFVNLDQKVYTTDEVRGLLRSSGYQSGYPHTEFINKVYNGDIISVEDFQKYQRPTSEKTLNDSINALIQNPEHPPLYYLMARFWMQWFGNPAAARSLAVSLSLLVFPCLYWLCIELFESPLTGWIAIALSAISPIHLLLAQEARQYSLWIVVTLLSSAAFLQALRLKTKQSWVIYAATIALGLYSHLYFAFVAFGHGIYILVIERLYRKNLRNYLLSSGAGMVIFLPWIWVILTQKNELKESTKWVRSSQVNWRQITEFFKDIISRVFIDFNNLPDLKNPIPYIILILVGYSIYFLCHHSPRQAWLFVLLLMSTIVLAQLLPDLVLGGRRSIIYRYYIPFYVGVQLAVSYLFAAKITSASVSPRGQKFWQLVLTGLISAGLLSCAVSSQSQTWWNKGIAGINVQVAAQINPAVKTLVITDANHTFTLPLSYLLDSKVQLQLFKDSELEQLGYKIDTAKLNDTFSDVFLYFPSNKLLNYLSDKPGVKLEVVVSEPKDLANKIKGKKWLYKLSKQ